MPAMVWRRGIIWMMVLSQIVASTLERTPKDVNSDEIMNAAEVRDC